MAATTKPQLRGLFITEAKKHFVGCAIACLITGLAYKYLYLEPKRNRYIEFMKNYDDDKILKRMNEAGLMQSYRPK